jgi:hypothetical protein
MAAASPATPSAPGAPAPKKRRTWLWILVGVLAFGVVCVITVAGVGIYFISKHVSAGPMSSAEALRSLDEARAKFKDERPLFELDRFEKPKLTKRLEDLPAGSTRAQTMHVLVWDPRKERLARVSLPFWMLRFGKNHVDLSGEFDVQRLHLDIDQLERIGPILLFDYRPATGQRVLVWTQ